MAALKNRRSTGRVWYGSLEREQSCPIHPLLGAYTMKNILQRAIGSVEVHLHPRRMVDATELNLLFNSLPEARGRRSDRIRSAKYHPAYRHYPCHSNCLHSHWNLPFASGRTRSWLDLECGLQLTVCYGFRLSQW